VPFLVQLPGTDTVVSSLRVIAFTGTRIVNSFALRTRQNVTARAIHDSSERPIKKQKSGSESNNDSEQHPQAAPAGAHLFASILSGSTPAALTLQQCFDIAEACKFYMADALNDKLATYFAPTLQSASICQVLPLLRCKFVFHTFI
jgi:hypothetical protein